MPIFQQPNLTESITGLAHDQGLPDLITRFQEIEFLDNPDKVVPLSKLSATNNLCINVPDMGSFTLTDWSKSQLSTLLGIRFDKWFENSSAEDQVHEMNRRFSRAENEIKIRSTLIGAGTNGTDGTIKAFTSIGFTPVRDSEVAQMILSGISTVEPNSSVISAHITSKTVSYSVQIGKVFSPGESSVGDLNGYLQIVNSSVGHSSLTITAKIFRLLCTNLMKAPIADARLISRKHTSGLSIESIGKEIGDKFVTLPGKIRQAGQVLQSARNVVIDNVEATITRILQQAHLPRKLLAPLMVAFSREPHPSAFGIAQALSDSRTITELGLDPETRILLETASGEFLRAATNPS